MDQADTMEIAAGLVHTRLPFGMVPAAAAVLAFLGVSLGYMLASPWLLIPLIPAWGFVRYQSAKEPLFLTFWISAMTFKGYYHP